MDLGLVAQSVEQRIENPCVGGSIPPRATKIHQNPLRVVFSCRRAMISLFVTIE